jgi:two-component system chemotaxis response regulator CheY
MIKPTRSVVVADDDRQVRDLVRHVMNQLGIEKVIEAANGEEAIRALRLTQAELAIIDRNMEVMDGLQCTRSIRAGINGIDPNLAIILLTGFRKSDAEKEAYAAGVDHYLEKPFSVRSLYWSIVKVRGDEPLQHMTAEGLRAWPGGNG